jgi:hypothetical protein
MREGNSGGSRLIEPSLTFDQERYARTARSSTANANCHDIRKTKLEKTFESLLLVRGAARPRLADLRPEKRDGLAEAGISGLAGIR